MSAAVTMPLFEAPPASAPSEPPSRDDLQRNMADAVLGLIDRGVASGIVEAPTGFGKALHVDEPVLTPAGWRKMGDLKVGDRAIGGDGKPCNVLGVYPQGRVLLYRVTFCDGTSVLACGEHQWLARDRRAQVNKAPIERQWSVVTTGRIRANIEARDGRPRWSIPMCKPVEFDAPDSPLPMDPYILGVLLGDGCFQKSTIGLSNPEPEIQEAVAASLPPGVTLKQGVEGGIDFRIVGGPSGEKSNPVLDTIRSLGLGASHSYEKHIPAQYKTASPSVRLALLQGLLDTDGSAQKAAIEYTTTSPALADDVVELVHSLGGKVHVQWRETGYTHNGELRKGRLSCRINVKIPGSIQPFRLPRKAAAYTPKTKYPPRRAIVSVEEWGIGEAVCIAVDSPDSTFVVRDYIVTHNTKLCADITKRLRDGRDWRAVFLVDERTLALQSEDALRHWGLRPTVEMGDRRAGADVLLAGDYDTVIATRQTLGRAGSGRYEAMLHRLRWPRVDLLVIDEAHCGPKGDQIKAVREMVQPRFTLGLSATPYLADGTRLVPEFFDEVAYSYPLEDYPDGRPGAIGNGHLVPPVTWDCRTSVDLGGLKTTMTEHGRDYKTGDLERVIGEKVGELVNAARMDLEQYGPFRRAMCFCPSVALAKAFADVWTQVGYRAAAVYGDHPDKDGVIRRYRDGDYRILCVCQMGIKGFDDPPTDALIMARPTKSYPMARQMLGRGLRLSPATNKERCLVLGFAWQHGKSGAPVSVLDIFVDGLPDPEVKAAAKKMMSRRKGPVDINELMREAKKEVADIRLDRQRKLRLAATRREVRHAVRERSILSVGSLPAKLERLPTYDGPRPVTKEQKARAKDIGIGDRAMRGHTASSFEAMLRTWEGRRDAGMSSYPQRNRIRYLKPSITDQEILGMTLREAGVLIDQLQREGRA